MSGGEGDRPGSVPKTQAKRNAAAERNARLAASLKANIAKRKRQAADRQDVKPTNTKPK